MSAAVGGNPVPEIGLGTPGGERQRRVGAGSMAWKRFARNYAAVASAVVLVLIALTAIFGPLVYGTDPNAVDPSLIQHAPMSGHALGTDSAGRDNLARLLVGARISLLVGLSVAVGATGIGLVLGVLAGYFRGVVDTLLSRVTEVVLSFPTLIIVIVIVTVTGPSLAVMIIALVLCEWPTAFRMVRAQTLSLRERESVLAAKGLGARRGRIMAVHIVPYVTGPLVVVGTFLVSQAILLEAGLSFLGLGVPAPTASWGNMLSQAQSLTTLKTMPWLWLPPGLAITLAVLAVNFLGDGLREATDPRGSR